MPACTEDRRAYFRKRLADRRAAYFENKVCVDCGSTDRLEVDHVDPSVKVIHRFWSWSPERVQKELDKCVPRCHDCHLLKSRQNGDLSTPKLTPAEVKEIRDRYVPRVVTLRMLADEYGVAQSQIHRIVTGKQWVGI